MIQTISPNPHIPCQPGWCLAYVNEAFRVPKVYGTASAAWEASPTKHRDYNFPPGVWVPLWFALEDEPAGHVVLRKPDGSVFSTSDLSTIPHHHPSLDHLIGYYAYYGMRLTYLGWTEDVEGTPVIKPPTVEEIIMALTTEDAHLVANAILDMRRGGSTAGEMVNEYRGQHLQLVGLIQGIDTRGTIDPAEIAAAIPEGIAQAVADAIAERLAS